MSVSTRCVLFLTLLPLPAPAAAELTIEGKITAAPAAATVQLIPLPQSFAAGELCLAGEGDPGPVASATVEAQGYFRVEAPEVGMWKVRVDAPGHASAELLLQPLLDAVELPALELESAADLDVEVRGGGKPLAARVIVYRADPAAGRFLGRRQVLRGPGAWSLPVAVGWSSEDGELRIVVGGNGPFMVRAVAPGFVAAEVEARDAGTVKLELAAGRERVVRAVDAGGRPVPGVLVYEVDIPIPLAATGPDGRARVTQGGEPLRLELVAGDGRRGGATLGDGPPPEVPVTLAAPPRLAGRVIDRGSRRPVGGALVWPAGSFGDYVTTAGDGAYELSGEPSPEGIWAAAAGYVTGFERARRAAGDVPGPTLALTPATAVAGRVVDAAGEPVAGVEIEASPQGETGMVVRMSSRPPSSLTARSSRLGAFRLGGLPAGEAYALAFRRAGYAETRIEVGKLAPFEQHTELEVVLRRGRRAVGLVRAEDDSPVAGATVRLTRRSDAGGGASRLVLRRLGGPEEDRGDEHATDARGRFEVGDLEAGRYDLEVEAEGFARAAVPGVEVPEDVNEVDLGTVVLAPAAAIAGLVVDAEGRPLAAAEIRYDRDAERPAAFLAAMLAGEPARARTDAGGAFTLSGFRDGERVHLLVSRAGYVDATVAAVTVPTVEPVEVVLRTASRVTGKVVDADGRPLAGARVVVQPEGQRFPGGRVETAGDGSFELADVAPGRVEVSAEAPGYQGASLAGLEVPAGGELAGVTLALAVGAVVEGTVFAPDALPVIGAAVRAVEPGASTGLRFNAFAFATTDGDGRYWLDGLPPGRRTVIAQHDVYQRAARDVEIEPGVNRLDLVFAGGVEVSGRVTGPQGEPVAGAQVMLAGDGFALRWPETASRDDGSFVFTGVLPGQYRLTAAKEGYAHARTSDPVIVGESPVAGLELRFAAGVTLTGEVRGLTVDELAELRIRASSGRGYRGGEVDFSGRYRVHNLGAGEWTVRAEVSGGGRQASGRVTVTESDEEVALDLEFGGGHVLTGTVLVGGQPTAGAWILVSGRSLAATSRATTSQDGTFRLEGLEAGTYELSVITASISGARHRKEVELTDDVDVLIELVTARLSGWVRDAFDRTPLSGVAVRLEEPAAGERPVVVFAGGGGESDSRGLFTLSEVPEGSWKLVARRAGYARAELAVDVSGAPIEGLEIEMTPSEGLFFEVALATGGAPQRIHAAALRGGEVVAAGNLETAENGAVRFTEVPPGAFELLVAAPGTVTVALPVVSPGRAGPVVLPAGGALRLIVPELESAPAPARATLVGPSGQPYRQVEWGGRVVTVTTLRGGRGAVSGLEPGLWTVDVTADDGRAWQGQARVTAGTTTDVTLD